MKVPRLRMGLIDKDTFIKINKSGLLKQRFSDIYRNALL